MWVFFDTIPKLDKWLNFMVSCNVESETKIINFSYFFTLKSFSLFDTLNKYFTYKCFNKITCFSLGKYWVTELYRSTCWYALYDTKELINITTCPVRKVSGSCQTHSGEFMFCCIVIYAWNFKFIIVKKNYELFTSKENVHFVHFQHNVWQMPKSE